MKKITTIASKNFNIPVIHNLRKLYAFIYSIGNKLSKRDKLGIHNHIEKELLKIFSLLINASFESKLEKIISLKKARLQIETLKQLIRMEYEIKIIPEKTYLIIELKLQEISKMTNGWLKYMETQNPLEGRTK
jgi:hypothetical protein